MINSVLSIRTATPGDSDCISRLLCNLTSKFIANEFSSEARHTLLSSMTPGAIEKYIQSGYRYHVADTDSQVVGVVAVRDNVHLFHLFVAEQYQRRGIATQLWKVAKTVCLNEGNPGEFTVNSSSFARDVYEKLGFISCSDPQEIDGILFYPMKLKLTGKT